jgi:hypothetical protein
VSLALADWRSILLTDLLSVPVSDVADEAIEPGLTRDLNGIDRLEFTLNMESQAAYQITPMKTLAKVWRDVPGYTPFPEGIPNFCGVIGGRVENAAARTVTYTAYAPFWRLQFRNHIDPHDFTYETGRGITDDGHTNFGMDPTDIMRLLIRFTNNVVQYTGGDVTGIVVDGAKADYFGAVPAVLYDIRYDVGQNTWDAIQNIVSFPGFPDLSPTYIHVEGSRDLVYFNTVLYKGETRALTLDYRTGAKNLDDLTRTVSVEPGQYANYVVVQGQQDKSTGTYNPGSGESGPSQTILRADGFSQASIDLGLPDLISEYGLYMHFEKDENLTNNEVRRKHGLARLRRLAYPPVAYEVSLSQALTWAWPYEFDVGDLLTLNCDRDSMQIAGAQVRVTQVGIKRTANKMEQVTVTVVDPSSYKVYEE